MYVHVLKYFNKHKYVSKKRLPAVPPPAFELKKFTKTLTTFMDWIVRLFILIFFQYYLLNGPHFRPHKDGLYLGHFLLLLNQTNA